MNILDEIKLDCEDQMKMYDSMPKEYRDLVKEFECCNVVYSGYKYNIPVSVIRAKIMEAIRNVTW